MSTPFPPPPTSEFPAYLVIVGALPSRLKHHGKQKCKIRGWSPPLPGDCNYADCRVPPRRVSWIATTRRPKAARHRELKGEKLSLSRRAQDLPFAPCRASAASECRGGALSSARLSATQPKVRRTRHHLLLAANGLLRGALAGANAVGDADSGKGIAGDEQAGNFLHALFDGGDAGGVAHRVLSH